MVLIRVTGDYTKVAQARACDQENTACAPNDHWTDTGISGAPVAASQVPATWGTESAGACANVTYTNVDVALDS